MCKNQYAGVVFTLFNDRIVDLGQPLLVFWKQLDVNVQEVVERQGFACGGVLEKVFLCFACGDYKLEFVHGIRHFPERWIFAKDGCFWTEESVPSAIGSVPARVDVGVPCLKSDS